MLERLKRLKRLLGLSGDDPREGCDGSGAPGGSGDGPHMIQCHEAMEKLYEYLDGELTGVEAEEVAQHFEVCAACYPQLAFERAFLDALHQAREGTTAPEPLRNRVLEVLQKEGFTPTTGS